MIAKKAGVVILISDKIDFKTKAIVRDKKRTVQNNKRINLTRGYNPCKHLYAKHRSTYIYKSNLDGHKGKD